VKGVKILGDILTSKPKLLVSQFSRFDLPNAKEMKQLSSSTFPKTFTCMPISTNLKHSRKERKISLLVEKVGQNHVKVFKSIGLAMSTKALDFMPISLNMDC
jgi:hypothetical protein